MSSVDSSSETRIEVERLRQELNASRRELSRLKDSFELDRSRWEAESSSLRLTNQSLMQSIETLTSQRNRDTRQRSEGAKEVGDLRAENARLRKELSALLDSKVSHLRVPTVSFDQYKELLAVVDSMMAVLSGGGQSGVALLPPAGQQVIQQAKEWTDQMQGAPFSSGASNKSDAAGAGAGDGKKNDSRSAASPVTPAASASGKSANTLEVIPVKESIVEGGKLVKIVSDSPNGGKQWSIQNTTTDTQFIVEFAFGQLSKVTPMGDTQADGRTLKLVLYPGETKPFVSGLINGYKMTIKYGPPDENYVPPISLTDSEILPVMDRVKHVWRRAGPSAEPSDIAQLCASESIPFIDVDFAPLSVSMVRAFELSKDHAPAAMKWLVPLRFLPKDVEPQICTTGVYPTALTDSPELADTWLISAFAALAEDPNIIGRIFAPTTEEDEHNGLYSAWVNKNGLWQVWKVDSFLPCRDDIASRKVALYGVSNKEPQDLWGAVLEKIFAKCHGSYESLKHGDPVEAFEDLTGFPTERFDWARDKDSVFNSVVKALSPSVSQTIGSKNVVLLMTHASNDAELRTVRSIGLKPHAAYRVLAAVSSEQFRLVLIRNSLPGDGPAWSGKWSEKSEAWSDYPATKAACAAAASQIPDPSSCFWMEWRSVMQHFAGCSVGYLRERWTDIRIANRFTRNKSEFMLQVKVLQPTRLFVGVHQRDRRGLPGTDPDHLYSAFLITVVGCNQAGTWDAIAQSHNGTYWRGRDAFLDVRLEPNDEPYFIVPRRYSAEGIKDTVISVLVENLDTVQLALREPSDEAVSALRYSPVWGFQPASCRIVEDFKCQVNKQIQSNLANI